MEEPLAIFRKNTLLENLKNKVCITELVVLVVCPILLSTVWDFRNLHEVIRSVDSRHLALRHWVGFGVGLENYKENQWDGHIWTASGNQIKRVGHLQVGKKLSLWVVR